MIGQYSPDGSVFGLRMELRSRFKAFFSELDKVFVTQKKRADIVLRMGNIFSFAEERRVETRVPRSTKTPASKQPLGGVPGPPPAPDSSVFTVIETYSYNKNDEFMSYLERMNTHSHACNMQLSNELNFFRQYLDARNRRQLIAYRMEDPKRVEGDRTVGFVVIIPNAVYRSYNRFAIGEHPNRYVIKVLCARAGYLPAVLRRLYHKTKYPHRMAYAAQIAVPLNEVRRFLEFEDFSLGLEPDEELKDVRRRLFFTGSGQPEPTSATATALFPVMLAHLKDEKLTVKDWSTVNAETNRERAAKALAQGIILSTRI